MIRIMPAILGAFVLGSLPSISSSQSDAPVVFSEDFRELPKECLELFVDAVHSRELCDHIEGTCQLPIQKRE